MNYGRDRYHREDTLCIYFADATRTDSCNLSRPMMLNKSLSFLGRFNTNDTESTDTVSKPGGKHIVMVQGTGNNERGWAKLVSKFARVTLIQQSFVLHVEIWADGQRIFNGPNQMLSKWRTLDSVSFGFISALRTLFSIMRFTKLHKIDAIIASNYYNVLAAIFLRWVGKATAVVAFLTDYLPPVGPMSVRLHRRATNYLMRTSSRLANEIWLVSPRIKTGVGTHKAFVVPIYISRRPFKGSNREEIVYIGHPTHDHALDILFRICAKHGFRLNVIGESSYLRAIKHLAPEGAVFYGLMNDEERISSIVSKCFCAYAIYRDTSAKSYSYYGFPSKTLYAFANNVPIVTTRVAWASSIYEQAGVGRVVEPTAGDIEEAILQLRADYLKYSTAIDRFRIEWNVRVEQFHRDRFAVMGVL